MKKIFIVLDALTFEVHKHPVFTGKIAYDLAQAEEIHVHEDLGVREFRHEGEVMTAVNDYMREHIGADTDREPITPFMIIQVMSVDVPQGGRAQFKSVKGLQPEKKSTK